MSMATGGRKPVTMRIKLKSLVRRLAGCATQVDYRIMFVI